MSISSWTRFSRLIGELEFVQALLELVDLGGAVVFFDAQFLLDRLELFAQKELALLTLHALFHRLADRVLGLGQLQLLVQQLEHLLHARQQLDGLQHVLQLMLVGGGEAGGKVGQMGGIVRAEAVQEHAQLLRVERIERQQFLDGIDDGDRIGLDLLAFVARFGQILDPGGEGGFLVIDLDDAESLQALHQHLQAPVRSAAPDGCALRCRWI